MEIKSLLIKDTTKEERIQFRQSKIDTGRWQDVFYQSR